MSTKMEVDSAQGEDASKKVSVHPLAIVNMSDQYTRITCGGSVLPKDAAVVGLLFGRITHDGLEIVDADDIPTDRSEAATQQVSLHQAVFPQNSVWGWYRVGTSEEPTAEDLSLTQELKAHYQTDGDEYKPFIFSLLQVRPAKEDPNAKMKDDANDNDDEELPLNLYEIQVHDGAAVLVGVDNWALETSEAERIAVERVVREQPQQDLKTTTTAAGGKDGVAAVQEILAAAPQPSPYVNYMTSVQQSLQAMDDRVKVIIDYLERMGKGEIPPNYSLLRQIQGLTLQLGPLQPQQQPSSGANSPTSDAELFSHLAAVAKTVQSVHGYTEKFRTLHENRHAGREGRRGY